MTTTVNLLMGIIIFIILICGVLIKYFKCYWLISGYNTLSDEEKLEVDVIGLSGFVGNCSFILAFILLVGSVFGYFGNTIAFNISISSVFIVVPYMLFGAQKYNRKQVNNKKIFFTIAFCIIVFVFVVSMFLYGTREPNINIDSQELSVLYGG